MCTYQRSCHHVTVTEVACEQLKLEFGQPDEEAASLLRNKMVSILQMPNHPSAISTKAERHALKSLKENKDTILLADNGKAVVVMDKDDYQS